MREYVKIYCCGDCIQYNWKKHKCNLGAQDEGDAREHFYRDCPLGIHKEEDAPTVEQKTGMWVNGKCNQCGEHAPFWQMASTYYEIKNNAKRYVLEEDMEVIE